MIRLFTTLFTILFTTAAFTQNEAAQFLSSGWKFATGDEPACTKSGFDDARIHWDLNCFRWD